MNKFRKPFQHGLALTLVGCVTLLSGCTTLEWKPSEPVTVGQVLQMTKEGVPPDPIVKKMRTAGTVYPLTASQLGELHDLGVADRVLNYMQDTYIEEQRGQQSREDWSDWDTWGFLVP